MRETPERQSEKPSLNEKETIAFLSERGVAPVPDDWQPHEPILYVLDEGIRSLYDKDGNARPKNEIASVARIDNPVGLKWTKKSITNPSDMLGYVMNDGGQIDYYAIHPDTKEPFWVGKNNPIKMEVPLYVKKGNTFAASDALFPKSSNETTS